jgi:ELP3 family radical SAM enzyme/protein acetyltransferase
MNDIEDVIKHNNNHKNKCFNTNDWNNLINEFNNDYINFKTNNDIIFFLKKIQKKFKITLSKADLIKLYNNLNLTNNNLKNLLIKKKQKSNSGVLVVTILTSAHPEYIDENGKLIIGKFSCKHNCAYCPNEKAHKDNNWVDQPRSYLYSEPAVLRANENNFDPILQFNSRIETLIKMGHNIDKIELIILGGTWSEYPNLYKDDFITKIYYAANTFYDNNKRNFYSLDKEISLNENATIHIIGLTIETRPDSISIDEIKQLRKYNCTRVQLGVQHTSNSVLKIIKRGHTIETVYNAIQILKNNCFKVDIHLMPNLPGSDYKLDKDMLEQSLYNPLLQADQYKIYPTAIVPWTKINEWFQNGTYIPYNDELLFKLIKEFKQKIQKWKRLNRIIRDIPSTYISGGYNKYYVNLRQLLQDDMVKNNWKCNCIRCREIKNNIISSEDIKLNILHYNASNGDEYFISYETDNYLIGFIRLRLNYNYEYTLDILKNTALIRELHVYSDLNVVGTNISNSYQHKGYGKKLIKNAENIALNYGFNKIAIISGTGVRNYYRKFGYNLKNTYMIKNI